MQTFGAYLKASREKMGLTLTEAAELAGYTRRHYARLESGDTVPGVVTFDALVKLFHMDVSTALCAYHDQDIMKRLERGARDHGAGHSASFDFSVDAYLCTGVSGPLEGVVSGAIM